MTYKELLDWLQSLSPADLESDISIEMDEEFFEVRGVYIYPETDVLDEGHPVIVVRTTDPGNHD